MLWRVHPLLWLGSGSGLLLIGLIAVLIPSQSVERPLIAYVAASLRPPLEAIAVDYQQQTGRRIELRFGGSEDLLTQARFSATTTPADLFLPADDSYLQKARQLQLIGDSFPLARMRGVVLRNPKHEIATWADLTTNGRKLALAEPSIAAIGLLTRNHLQATGRWDELDRAIVVKTDTVTQSANAVKLGTVDAAIVWDAVAYHFPELPTVRLSELDGIVATVPVAVLTQSPNPLEAIKFARFIANQGLRRFQEAGFEVITPSGERTP